VLHLDQYHHCDPSCINSGTPTMLEVGAYSADLAFAFLSKYPKGRVEIFEAAPDNFASLIESIAGDPRIKARNTAVTDKDGDVRLNIYTDRNSNSTFDRHVCDGKELLDSVTVPSISLSTALNNVGTYVDYLLLNCEGGELSIMDAISRDADLRDRVGQICVSFHHNHSTMYAKSSFYSLMLRLHRQYAVHEINKNWGYYLLRSVPALG